MSKSLENFLHQQNEMERLEKERRERFELFKQKIYDLNYEKYGKNPELWREAEKLDLSGHKFQKFNELADNFFSYQTIISRSENQAEYNHSEACLWFLWMLAENKEGENTERVIEAIDFTKPFESWMKLSNMKLAKDIKLAEVYGTSYARLIALLGGEGTFWDQKKAGIIKSYDKEKYKVPIEYSEELKDHPDYLKFPIDHIVSFVDFHGNETSLNTNNEECDEGNLKKVFKEKYDIFMAVNCGEWTNRPHNLATSICEKKENRYITNEEPSTFYHLHPKEK